MPSFTEARTKSWWMEEAGWPLTPPGVITVGDVSCDVCVIGGGYVGLWTALRVKEQEPAADVLVVDASGCGTGASGRNGGWAMSLWPKVETLAKRYGIDTARALARESEHSITELCDFATSEGIEAQIERAGWIMAAASQSQMGAWDAFRRWRDRFDSSPYIELDGDEASKRTRSPQVLGGLLDPTVALVQPAMLAAGLRAAAERRGVRLLEHAPVRRVSSDGVVVLDTGRVRVSGAVVLALGGWAAGVPELRRSVIAVGTDAVATEPADPGSAVVGREAVTTSRMTLRYWRGTGSGRVVFGMGARSTAWWGRLGKSFASPSGLESDWAGEISHYLPSASGMRVTHMWRGPVDRSMDGLPLFGCVGRGSVPVLYGTGFSGNGVATSVTAGRILASLALGADDEWSHHPFVAYEPGRFPTEPFLSVGGEAVRRAVHAAEDRQEAGRPVPWAVRRLAAAAPSGLVTLTSSSD
jgi:glycine/D-amino acid oxidase-like deaminating enzyme